MVQDKINAVQCYKVRSGRAIYYKEEFRFVLMEIKMKWKSLCSGRRGES